MAGPGSGRSLLDPVVELAKTICGEISRDRVQITNIVMDGEKEEEQPRDCLREPGLIAKE